LAVVGRARDDTRGWRRWGGWWSAATDDELGAAATVDPDALTVYAPSTSLDAGRATDLANETNIATAADVAPVSFAVIGGAGDL
jgi:hypothetical protein